VRQAIELAIDSKPYGALALSNAAADSARARPEVVLECATVELDGEGPAVPVSRPVSVFVVPHRVRLGERFAGVARGRPVWLLRVEGETKAQVQAFGSALRPFLAARRERPA